MLVRFHLSTGAILDKDVPNMNDIGHVANTLAKFGRVYIDDFKGAILKEHVVYMEEVDKPEEVHGLYYADSDEPGNIIKAHYPLESIHTSHFEPQDNEPVYHREREQWHPGRS